jgi:hypothetical protein
MHILKENPRARDRVDVPGSETAQPYRWGKTIADRPRSWYDLKQLGRSRERAVVDRGRVIVFVIQPTPKYKREIERRIACGSAANENFGTNVKVLALGRDQLLGYSRG